MSERRRRRKNTEEGGSEDSSDESIQDKLLYSDQGSEGANSEYESADEEEIHTAGAAAPAQTEPTEEEQKLDDDEDRKNPQYIPKRGGFYEHDDRTMPLDEDEQQPQQPQEGADGEQTESFPGANLPVVPISSTTRRSESEDARPDSSKPLKKRVWKGDSEKWSHDKFEEAEQTPKPKDEIVTSYGYDIRSEDGAPRARRRRRYGRGPNKYTRNWEDMDAYARPPSARGGGAVGGRGPRRGGRGGNGPPPTMENQQEFPSLGETDRSTRDEDQTMNPSGDQDNNRRTSNRGNQQDFPQQRSGNSGNRQNNNPLQGQQRSEHGAHTYTNQEYRKGKESRGRGERGARRRGGDRGGNRGGNRGRGRGGNYEEDFPPPQLEQQQLPEGRPSPSHRQGQSSPSHGRGDSFKKGGYPPHTPQYSSPQHSNYGNTSQKRYSSSRPGNNPVSPTSGFPQQSRHMFYQGSPESSPQNPAAGELIGGQGLVNPPTNPIPVQNNPVMDTPSAHVYEYSTTQRQAVPLPASLPPVPHQFVPPVTFGAPPPTAYFAAVPHPPQTLQSVAPNTPMIRPQSNFIPPTEHSAPIAMNPQQFQAQPGSGAPLHPPQYPTYHPPPGYVPPVEQTPPTVPHPTSSGQTVCITSRQDIFSFNTITRRNSADSPVNEGASTSSEERPRRRSGAQNPTLPGLSNFFDEKTLSEPSSSPPDPSSRWYSGPPRCSDSSSSTMPPLKDSLLSPVRSVNNPRFVNQPPIDLRLIPLPLPKFDSVFEHNNTPLKGKNKEQEKLIESPSSSDDSIVEVTPEGLPIFESSPHTSGSESGAGPSVPRIAARDLSDYSILARKGSLPSINSFRNLCLDDRRPIGNLPQQMPNVSNPSSMDTDADPRNQQPNPLTRHQSDPGYTRDSVSPSTLHRITLDNQAFAAFPPPGDASGDVPLDLSITSSTESYHSHNYDVGMNHASMSVDEPLDLSDGSNRNRSRDPDDGRPNN